MRLIKEKLQLLKLEKKIMQIRGGDIRSKSITLKMSLYKSITLKGHIPLREEGEDNP